MKPNKEAIQKRILQRYHTLDTMWGILHRRQEAIVANRRLGITSSDLLVRDTNNAEAFYNILLREQEYDVGMLEFIVSGEQETL
jgi:hypothetical protein